MARLFAARICVSAGGRLAILQSSVVFCHNFSKCIFSSRTQEQADGASSEAERCRQGPGTGRSPHTVQTASPREPEPQGLRGHSHALGSVGPSSCWGHQQRRAEMPWGGGEGELGSQGTRLSREGWAAIRSSGDLLGGEVVAGRGRTAGVHPAEPLPGGSELEVKGAGVGSRGRAGAALGSSQLRHSSVGHSVPGCSRRDPD